MMPIMRLARLAAPMLCIVPACLAAQAPAAAPTRDALEARIRARLDSLPASTSMYARNLATGQEVAVRADEPMNTASVIKLPVMVLAYRDSDAGRLNLDERHTIRAEDLRRGSGLLQTFQVGLQPTYRDLIAQMIVTSDNTATDIMIAKVGLARVNQMLGELGFRETRLIMTTNELFRAVWEMVDPAHRALMPRQVYERGFPTDSAAASRSFALVGDSAKWLGRTTAREISRLLEQIQRCQVASQRSCDEMLAVLRRQLYSSRLPQRLAGRASIGHKTGDWPPYLGNDVGVMYHRGGPTVIAVFTNRNRGSFFELEATIGRIAEDVLEAWMAR
jgi:beta-lactamase class A